MKVAVRFFARYREAAGRDHVELDLPEGGTVESAWEAVVSRFPVLQPYRPFTLFALGTDYVPPTHPLHAGDELCFFPPGGGGANEHPAPAPRGRRALLLPAGERRRERRPRRGKRRPALRGADHGRRRRPGLGRPRALLGRRARGDGRAGREG